MARTLRLLLVEDSPDDADILLRVLARGGYATTHRRVETAEDMRAALATESWDMVISDFSLPRFSAAGALAGLQASGLDLPFIVVSGAIGEDSAVSLLKAGAHDFLMKGHLARLIPAIERELRDAEERAGRRAANEALQRSEDQYRRIVETARDGIWITDLAGRTRYVNRRMAELLGENADALAGIDIHTRVDAAVRAAIDTTLGDNRVCELHDIEFVRVDGSRFIARVSVRDFPVADGDGVLFMVTDTTEQRQLSAQLMASDRMSSLGMLAAGVAHEINNPLATLLGSLDAIHAEIDSMPRAVRLSLDGHHCLEHLAHAREAADRVREIARDLRIYSRDDDRFLEPVDVHETMESAIRMAQHEIRHRARLVRDYRPSPSPRGSASRLGQVFLNLLVNAAQAIDGRAPRKEIRVALYTGDDGGVVAEVQDSGSGMTPEVRDRLFTPFFTTKGPGIGTGLGLSICQRIIAGMNGTIEVDTSPGEGSTFRVRLPAPDLAPRPVGPTAAAPAGRPTRRRVLVLDDDPVTVRALQRALAGHHDVNGSSNTAQALAEILAGVRYDAILCDLMMPELNGMAFHAALLQDAPDQARRVVFLSGGAFTPQAIAFLAQDGIRRIDKPWEQDVLLQQIEEVAALPVPSA